MKFIVLIMAFFIIWGCSDEKAADKTDDQISADNDTFNRYSDINQADDKDVTIDDNQINGDSDIDIISTPDSVRTFTFINKCSYTVWPGILGADNLPVPKEGGWRQESGTSVSVVFEAGWRGRMWGRTGCVFDNDGKGKCLTGDCGGKEKCSGSGGKPPATLAEFAFDGYGGVDFYDVSLVDGSNIPLGIIPVEGTYTKNGDNIYSCGSPLCVSDLNLTCPDELQIKDDKNNVVACMSACEKFQEPQYCCTGDFNKPETCPPTQYSKIFKEACPNAYSYPYDDPTSTFTCKGEDYIIVFCP